MNFDTHWGTCKPRRAVSTAGPLGVVVPHHQDLTGAERYKLEAEIAREQAIIERQADQLAAMRHSSTPSRLVRVVWTRMH